MSMFNLRKTSGAVSAEESGGSPEPAPAATNSWIYDDAALRPNVATGPPTDCRSRSYPRRVSTLALFTYQALQREAGK